ncbi:hypothetical protein V6N13_146253 [Hibiscus sabdariffa]
MSLGDLGRGTYSFQVVGEIRMRHHHHHFQRREQKGKNRRRFFFFFPSLSFSQAPHSFFQLLSIVKDGRW